MFQTRWNSQNCEGITNHYVQRINLKRDKFGELGGKGLRTLGLNRKGFFFFSEKLEIIEGFYARIGNMAETCPFSETLRCRDRGFRPSRPRLWKIVSRDTTALERKQKDFWTELKFILLPVIKKTALTHKVMQNQNELNTFSINQSKVKNYSKTGTRRLRRDWFCLRVCSYLL